MPILDIAKEKHALEAHVSKWFRSIKQHTEEIPNGLYSQVERLSDIRKELYEDLNQLQHAAMIIKVAEQLQREYVLIDQWHWHPKQTSDPDLADLTGYVNDEVFLNAEITTSFKPEGTIDKRMKSTLMSLHNNKNGLKFYFVLTNEMYARAQKKKVKNNFDVTIRLLTSAP